MSNQSPSDMVLPVEVIRVWATRYKEAGYAPEAVLEYVAWESAQWGADQELEACVEWLGDAPVVWNNNKAMHPGSFLRTARRPNPPSLKEQALAEVAGAVAGGNITPERGAIICKALEALPND